MALIKSISGIRGTIGGAPGDNLTPIDMVKFAAAYGKWLKSSVPNNETVTVVVGRDGRVSGQMVKQIITATLSSLGINVIDTDYSTTPTVEMAVKFLGATGGIILTASHNPKEWNALKLLNEKGEFISGEEGALILKYAEQEDFDFVSVDELGTIVEDDTTIDTHIIHVLQHDLVDVEAIEKANFNIVADVVNSTGAIALPKLFKALGVSNYTIINEENTGHFAHNPEPLPQHLVQLSEAVVERKADLGIAVDPDVDRLCFVCEDGTMFGEEYTLVAVADYILTHRKGDTVSNMSSTRALRDVTEKHGGSYYASAVGEVNVVNKMKEVEAVIGGEGNGGVIVPELHYGRDALIGIGLFLSHLAKTGLSVKELRASYPSYFMSKQKIDLHAGVDAKAIFAAIAKEFENEKVNTEDGLKIDFATEWVQLRTSNTEPIIRVYTESKSEEGATALANKFVQKIKGHLPA